MTTAGRHQQQQQSRSHFVVADAYDPDEVVPRDSPLMTPLRPRLELSPSPSPDIPPAQVSLSLSLSPTSADRRDKANRHKVRPSSGDAVLVSYLDDGRDPELHRAAGRQALPCDDEEDSPDADIDATTDPDQDAEPDDIPSPVAPPAAPVMTSSLQNLAADALQVAFAGVPPPSHAPVAVAVAAAVAVAPSARPSVLNAASDITIPTTRLSLRDDLPPGSYNPRDLFSSTDFKPGAQSPPSSILTPPTGELPPLQMDSPRSESNGQMLPSIRSTLGDINRLSDPLAPADKDMAVRHGPVPSFPRSPPGSIHRFPALATNHVSPPISPNDGYPRNLPSPHSLPASSPFYGVTNGIQHRPSVEYSSSTAGETPSTDQSGSTPATSTSVAERMSIDGITNPNPHYVCNVPGCNAPPFQTQYLLNSHANVHSSARPHYCSVQGCPRSEGGKGFKRKNEMIRHGLVHDSPGYVCPFCPDREHKYPRPDNLQRYATPPS